jgi:hypothetical protein
MVNETLDPTTSTGHTLQVGPVAPWHLGPQAALLTLEPARRAKALWLLHGLHEAWSPGLALSLPRLMRDMRPDEHTRVLQAFVDLLQAGSLLISLAPRSDGVGEG